MIHERIHDETGSMPRALSPADARYPSRLAEVPDAPATLHVHDVDPITGEITGEPPLFFEGCLETFQRGRSQGEEGVDGRLARTAESPALRRPEQLDESLAAVAGPPSPVEP